MLNCRKGDKKLLKLMLREKLKVIVVNAIFFE